MVDLGKIIKLGLLEALEYSRKIKKMKKNLFRYKKRSKNKKIMQTSNFRQSPFHLECFIHPNVQLKRYRFHIECPECNKETEHKTTFTMHRTRPARIQEQIIDEE